MVVTFTTDEIWERRNLIDLGPRLHLCATRIFITSPELLEHARLTGTLWFDSMITGKSMCIAGADPDQPLICDLKIHSEPDNKVAPAAGDLLKCAMTLTLPPVPLRSKDPVVYELIDRHQPKKAT